MTASWINSLVDSGVKSDMLNFAADGVFTYAEAYDLLANVTNRGSVTANEIGRAHV